MEDEGYNRSETNFLVSSFTALLWQSIFKFMVNLDLYSSTMSYFVNTWLTQFVLMIHKTEKRS